MTLGLATDVVFLVDVELVVDVAHDLLDGVFDRDEPGDPTVLVDHDGHMVAVAAELLEQDVNPLGFRHHHRRTRALADVEIFGVA